MTHSYGIIVNPPVKVSNVTRTVFYAWQSDCPSGTNRGFIRKALKKAVERLNDEGYDVAVDEGTAGVAGMPVGGHWISSRSVDLGVPCGL